MGRIAIGQESMHLYYGLLKGFAYTSSKRLQRIGRLILEGGAMDPWRSAVTNRKKVRGEVLYNDGDFAEIQTIGTEGIERGLLLGTIQIYRSDTADAVVFQRRFKIGTRLYISTTIEARIGCGA